MCSLTNDYLMGRLGPVAVAPFVVLATACMFISSGSAVQTGNFGAVLCPDGCSGRGACSATGACLCLQGWGGRSCNYPLSQRKPTLLASVYHGQSQGAALQGSPRYGQEAYSSAQTCVGGCSGRNGACVAGACICESGYYGPTCAISLAAGANQLRTPTHSLWSLTKSAQLTQAEAAVQDVSAAADRLLAAAEAENLRDLERDTSKRLDRALAKAHQHFHDRQRSLGLYQDVATWTEGTKANVDNSTVDSFCGPSDCSGHGQCNVTAAQCKCDSGWSGQDCDAVMCKDNCSNSGLCVGGSCICEAEFYGDSCQHKRCPSDCSGNGYCFQGRCQCIGDYGGDACASLVYSSAVKTYKLKTKLPAIKGPANAAVSTLRSEAKTTTCDSNCSGHGECSSRASSSGQGECICESGWFGTGCSSYCPDSCHGHGECIHGACLCDSGWSGPSCSIEGQCNGRGTVRGHDCDCDEGWTGADCGQQVVCVDPVCSGHGVCQDTGICMCGAGYSGLSCEINAVSCEGRCGEHGACSMLDSTCTCHDGWSGRSCEISLWACPNSCSGHGTCMNGVCSCWPEYEGDACNSFIQINSDFTVPRYPNCSEAGLSLLETNSSLQPCAGINSSNMPAASLVGASAEIQQDKTASKSMGPSTASWLPQLKPVALPTTQVSSVTPTSRTVQNLETPTESSSDLEVMAQRPIQMQGLHSTVEHSNVAPSVTIAPSVAAATARSHLPTFAPDALAKLVSSVAATVPLVGSPAGDGNSRKSVLTALGSSGFQVEAQRPMQAQHRGNEAASAKPALGNEKPSAALLESNAESFHRNVVNARDALTINVTAAKKKSKSTIFSLLEAASDAAAAPAKQPTEVSKPSAAHVGDGTFTDADPLHVARGTPASSRSAQDVTTAKHESNHVMFSLFEAAASPLAATPNFQPANVSAPSALAARVDDQRDAAEISGEGQEKTQPSSARGLLVSLLGLASGQKSILIGADSSKSRLKGSAKR